MSKHPAGYMFKEIPKLDQSDDYLEFIIGKMDQFNIKKAMVGCDPRWTEPSEAWKRHRHRFILDYPVNPNLGMEDVFNLKRLHREHGVGAASVFPCGLNPQVPINDKKMYPLYAACVELGIPIMVNVGVPGPRVPMAPQQVERVDEVCWFFPELQFIMRHGAEPWEDLAIKLMLKYPNLYYSPSAFAPKHYPKAIINFANTRGSNQVMYAGYFPMGLSLDRIFKEMRSVPFKDSVWPKFLYGNAKRVFGF